MPPDVLRLNVALKLAMGGHPGLSAGASGVKAAEARTRQARVVLDNGVLV